MVRPLLPRTMSRRRANDSRLEWFGKEVSRNIKIGLSTRMKVVAQLLRDRVVTNISEPVTKKTGARSGRVQVDPASRSKPGEFPRADTTRLQKDIFWDFNERKIKTFIGTTLDYGLILETRMNRSFLRRTLGEVSGIVPSIIGRNRPSDFPKNNE